MATSSPRLEPQVEPLQGLHLDVGRPVDPDQALAEHRGCRHSASPVLAASTGDTLRPATTATATAKATTTTKAPATPSTATAGRHDRRRLRRAGQRAQVRRRQDEPRETQPGDEARDEPAEAGGQGLERDQCGGLACGQPERAQVREEPAALAGPEQQRQDRGEGRQPRADGERGGEPGPDGPNHRRARRPLRGLLPGRRRGQRRHGGPQPRLAGTGPATRARRYCGARASPVRCRSCARSATTNVSGGAPGNSGTAATRWPAPAGPRREVERRADRGEPGRDDDRHACTPGHGPRPPAAARRRAGTAPRAGGPAAQPRAARAGWRSPSSASFCRWRPRRRCPRPAGRPRRRRPSGPAPGPGRPRRRR